MKFLFRSILISSAVAAALLAAPAASAQDLHEEVTVRYDEAPRLREYQKLNINPRIDLAPVRLTPLPYSRQQVRISPTPGFTTLSPTAYADSIYSSPYRGYAALGFMPKYNLGVSAGYKIFDTDHTRLNAWIQYDGTAYSAAPHMFTAYGGNASTAFGDKYVRRNTATIGATLHQAVGSESFIDLGTDYTFARYNTISGTTTDVSPDYANQNAHRYNLSARWTLSHSHLNYGIGAAYSHFGYSNAIGFLQRIGETEDVAPALPVRQNLFDFGGFFAGQFAGSSAAGIDVKISHLSSPRNAVPTILGSSPLVEASGVHSTLLHFSPYYRLDLNSFIVDLGLNVDLTFNDGRFFHISPRAAATWIPKSWAKIYLKASGCEWQNTAASLFDVSPYAMPFQSYGNSHIPLDAEFGINIGPVKGAYLELAASYSIANDWLMPTYSSDQSASTYFETIDLKGFKFHAALGYRYNDLLEFRASYDAASHRRDRGYYLWRDRANNVVDLSLRVTPIKPLDINLGWEYRGGRKIFFSNTLSKLEEPLRSINNLTAGATYRFTSQWSAFLRGENLLNRHYYFIGFMPSQGITGLAGVTYKF